MPKENNNKKEKKHFFKDFKAELKKVIWPTPKQLVNNTVAVITIVLITAIIVFVLDFVFEKTSESLYKGINSKNKNEISNEVNLDENETTDNGDAISDEVNVQNEASEPNSNEIQ